MLLAPPAPPTTARRFLPALLLLLTAFGPISMDLYLPALPSLARELGASTSVAQLTITACLVGLALGQLVTGPLSDRLGRRGILRIGIVAYIAASALCALSPTVEFLIVARLVQGFAGGVGLVISQAAGRDVFTGRDLLRFFARVTVVGGLAAVIGPLAGGLLSAFTDWRGLFVLLAVIGALILAATMLVFTETLPVENRTTGGFGSIARDVRTLIRDRVFVGAVLNQGFMYAATFAYLSGATFVLQDIYGLNPLQYALAFGANSAGFMLFGFLAGRLAERFGPRRVIGLGVTITSVGSLGLLIGGLTPVSVWVVIASLFLVAAGVATTASPTTLLALAEYPHIAGTASSLLGAVRFGFGALAAPLVGIAGALTMLPLGVVTVCASVLAAASLILMRRPAPRP